jgi:hypothetical protein
MLRNIAVIKFYEALGQTVPGKHWESELKGKGIKSNRSNYFTSEGLSEPLLHALLSLLLA